MGKGKIWIKLGGVAITSMLIFGTLVLASSSPGGESDPLITKSYLDQYVTPTLQSEINAQAEAEIDRLLVTLNEELELLQEQVAANTNRTGQYEVVTLSKGEELVLDLGSQVVLRIGTATVTSTENPALVDLTQGSTLNSGTNLTVNHLYLSSIEGRTLTATANTTKIMVYGGYVINQN